MNVIIATTNRHKLNEFKKIFAGKAIQFTAQSDLGDIPAHEETGQSFVENAIAKARHLGQYTKGPILADDSGLCVAALDGQPGIYSARYAEHGNDALNRTKLLEALSGVPETSRQAYFYCVLVWLRHANDPTPIIASASWHGVIAQRESGQKGFGYDPIFYLPEQGMTAAELSPEEKNRLSHRGKAAARLLLELSENLR